MGIDPENRAVLEEATRDRRNAFFSCDGVPITFQTFVLEVGEDHVLVENRVPPRFIRQVCESSHFALQVGLIRLKSETVDSDGENIVFPLKEDSVIEETRQSRRFSFTADERVVCEILNPFDGETQLSKTVMDMSATGLSLRTSHDSRLFQPDTRLPHLKVLIDGEPYNQGAGRVVYNRKLMDLGGHLRLQVGIKFE